jgi:PAS domain S-box-containing protein
MRCLMRVPSCIAKPAMEYTEIKSLHDEIPALLETGNATAEDWLQAIPARILIVDDSPAMLQSLVATLDGLGLEVAPVTSGRAALRLLLQYDFAVILLDVHMPEMDGFETATLIRSRPRSAHVPILFVTAASRDELDMERGYRLGAVDFIHTPIRPEILRAKVRGFADLFRLSQRIQLQAEEISLQNEMLRENRRLLERAHAEQQAILASASSGIVLLKNRVVVHCNRRLREILQWPEQRLIGHSSRLWYPSEADFERVGVEAYHEIQQGQIHRREQRLQRQDGSTVWTRMTGRAVDVADLSKGSVWLIDDITVERAAMDELRRAQVLAESAARIKSDFLANMSHEIRTPLNGVLGLAQIGYRDSAGQDKIQDTFARILDSGKLLLTIINDILDFSKIEAGKLSIEAVPFSPRQLTEQAAQQLAEHAQTKGLALLTQVGDDLPLTCLGDPTRIAQILLNLLSNAVKFTERGHIELSTPREGDELLFRVTDTGIGIAPEDYERLFQAFEQADSTTTRQHGGTGLGLAISRRLAELMGGRLTVKSKRGQGSTFELRLPLLETDLPLPEPGVATLDGQRLAGLHVLVADDNEVNLLVLEEFLRIEGASLRLVPNGRLALEAVAQEPNGFDAVLMDVQMPEMDGLEATRRIRAIAPRLPVIGQTAHALKEEHERCFAAGMAATVTKPIDEDLLVATMLKVLHAESETN